MRLFRFSRSAAVAVALVSFVLTGLAMPASAAKEWSTLRVLVEDEAGKPVPRASVVISRLKSETSTKIKGDPMQLRTSLEGAAPLPPLPQGFYLLQVIAKGYQTFGGKLELNETEQTHTVTLQLPQKQFSVHTEP